MKGAKNGPDSKDLAELAVGTPDGRSPLTCHYSVLFKLFFFFLLERQIMPALMILLRGSEMCVTLEV